MHAAENGRGAYGADDTREISLRQVEMEGCATRNAVAVKEVNSNTCKAKQLDQTLIFN